VSTLTVEKPAYLLDHDWEQEPYRLALLEHHADPTSAARLRATGLGAGWRCLEVGAGRGSVARWMATQVGPSGHVTALDLDTSLLSGLDEPNVEVRCGDVLDMDLREASFDLIHTRLVLMHIPERRRAIERMVSLLAPGGWVVAEELDWMAVEAEADSERVALFSAFEQGLPTIDFACGRALLRELREAGLKDTAADCRVDVVEGATPLARWEQLSVQALSEEVLAAGTATAEQIDSHIARLQQPEYRGFGFTWIGARGRRESRS
jgi:2-polyprenyl-3-methyl-5-hydroxy-6-metoxy-1,4-benzoquinol methylase